MTDEKGTFTATEVRDLLATNAIKRINDRTVARIVDMVNELRQFASAVRAMITSN